MTRFFEASRRLSIRNTRRALARRLAAGVAALAVSSGVAAAGDGVVDIIAAPNPHVLPLLIALEENEDLPVRLVPVAGGKDFAGAFEDGADAILAMTYVGANLRQSGTAPDLSLAAITTWRGFFEVASPRVSSFEDLKGETVVVSGPVGSGAGGGGDIIFRAAAKRQGVDPDTDLNLVYAPVSEGREMLKAGDAAAIAVPAPASTGLVMSTMLSRKKLAQSIDFQSVFSGYDTFPQGQLPLGGVHIRTGTFEDPEMTGALRELVAAYADAARKLEADPGKYAKIASRAFEEHYSDLGAPTPPARVISAAVKGGDLVYRSDIPVVAVRADLSAWLEELLGFTPDAAFLSGAPAAPSAAAGTRPSSPQEARAAMRERMRSRRDQ